MMRKLIFTALAATVLTACGGGEKSVETDSFNEFRVEKRLSLTDAKNAPQCQIDLRVKYVEGNDERARRINSTIAERLFEMQNTPLKQAADSFATAYTQNYRKDMAPFYRQDAHDSDRKAWYEYAYSVATEVESGREGVIIYTIALKRFDGGAHPIEQQLTLNFDATTGKTITLDSLFTPGYMQPLEEMLLEALKDQVDARSLDELHEKGYLLTMDIFAPQNYKVGSDGISFIYNPYEIAPYAMGCTTITLSYSDMEKIMKNEE